MTWNPEPDPADEGWAGTLFRDDRAGRLLWLRAGGDVPDPTWLLQALEEGEGGVRTVADERPVPVSDAVALAPEVAQDVMRVTRVVLARYAVEMPEGGLALAEELRDAVRELERDDVAAANGTHTKRGEDVVPPVDYGA